MLVDSGRSDLLSVVVGNLAVDSYSMGLYVNNYALVEGDTFGALTEATFAGYARVTLGGWGTPTGPVAGVWDSIASNVVFTNSSGSPVTVYGFCYFGFGRGIFYGGDLFATPIVIPAGSSIVVSPSWFDTGA